MRFGLSLTCYVRRCDCCDLECSVCSYLLFSTYTHRYIAFECLRYISKSLCMFELVSIVTRMTDLTGLIFDYVLACVPCTIHIRCICTCSYLLIFASVTLVGLWLKLCLGCTRHIASRPALHCLFRLSKLCAIAKVTLGSCI